MAMQTQPLTLAPQGMSRTKQLLNFLPFGRTTLYKLVKDGKFPQPIKLGKNITAWHNADVLAWLDSQQSA